LKSVARDTNATATLLIRGAWIQIVALCVVVRVIASLYGVADVISAWVVIITLERFPREALLIEAQVSERTGITVIAG